MLLAIKPKARSQYLYYASGPPKEGHDLKIVFPKYIIAIVFCLTIFTLPARALEWDTYTNGLYGYKICYPAGLLKPGNEAADGDGNTFTSAAGATLKVWGSYNAAGESLQSLTADLLHDFEGHAKIVSYRRHTNIFSVVSGQNDNMIFYAKIMLNKDGYQAFQLTYPKSQSDIYNSVSARLSACFQTAPPSQH